MYSDRPTIITHGRTSNFGTSSTSEDKELLDEKYATSYEKLIEELTKLHAPLYKVLIHALSLQFTDSTLYIYIYILLFWKKLYCSDSAVLQSLSRRMHQTFVAVGSLYNVLSPKLSNNSVRELIWNSFAMSVDL